jgi:hypothetical protein
VKQINIKQYVNGAVRDEWAAFAERHPNLARVCDQDLVADAVTETLEDDRAYQDAMADAYAAGKAAKVAGDFAKRLVREWMKRLGA